jgi:maltose alpha-D-glucosyltransferase/alpha-amylase
MAGEAENEIFPMIPDDRSLRTLLLEAFVIEKNLYELTYELDHRPDWFDVPLNGLLDYLASSD